VRNGKSALNTQLSSDEVSVAINVASAVVCARLSALPVRLWPRRRPRAPRGARGEVHIRIMSPLIVPPRVRNMRYTPPNNAADDPMRALL